MECTPASVVGIGGSQDGLYVRTTTLSRGLA
jgi:hypothetical protein